MSSMAAKLTAAFFESKGLNYDYLDEDQNAIITGFGLNNVEGIKILIIFDEGDHSVHLMALNVAKFPADKKDGMYAVVNALNKQFRWIKFVVDEKENCINAEDDAIIQLDSCGEEVFECCLHFGSVVDKAYPVVMKSVFA